MSMNLNEIKHKDKVLYLLKKYFLFYLAALIKKVYLINNIYSFFFAPGNNYTRICFILTTMRRCSGYVGMYIVYIHTSFNKLISIITEL